MSREASGLAFIFQFGITVFHGGKYPYPDGHINEPARDRKLLSASLTVMEECLRTKSIVGGKVL